MSENLLNDEVIKVKFICRRILRAWSVSEIYGRGFFRLSFECWHSVISDLEKSWDLRKRRGCLILYFKE